MKAVGGHCPIFGNEKRSHSKKCNNIFLMGLTRNLSNLFLPFPSSLEQKNSIPSESQTQIAGVEGKDTGHHATTMALYTETMAFFSKLDCSWCENCFSFTE